MYYHASRALFVSGHAQHALHFDFSVVAGASVVVAFAAGTEFPIVNSFKFSRLPIDEEIKQHCNSLYH
jgi:precorrin-2 methylase